MNENLDVTELARHTEDWANREIDLAIRSKSSFEIHRTAERVAAEILDADWEYLLLYTFGGSFSVKLTQYKH